MEIELNVISGIMFGVEYVEAEDRHIVIDIGFLRILVTF